MADFFVNQSGDSFSALTSSLFPSLADFSSAATADALKWTDLEQDVVYQLFSTSKLYETQLHRLCSSSRANER